MAKEQIRYMQLDHKIWAHLLLAGFAVSVFCVAGIQALLLSLQERQLRNKHVQGIIKILPPLETMEVFLFRIIWCGFFLLTVVLVTSWYFFAQEMLTPYLWSKILIVILAWVFFAVLLAGRHGFGLRGKRAVYGTLSGTILLVIVYIVSRFV